ncbi:phage protein [Burkholderia gladioli]|uniref:phage protein n=1 Tax=Burkholderia gladioli TaxID=28095 RepID=UPI002FE26917
MTYQYLRKASLIIGNDDDALDLSDLQFTFAIRRGDIQTPNSARIRIFNLSDNTAQRISGEFTRVVLQAGYQDGPFGVIFDGTIKQVRRGRFSQVDTVTDVTAASGDQWYTYATIRKTLASGSTYMDHVQAVVDSMKPYGLTVGYMPQFDVNPLPRGRVLVGMAREIMRNAAYNLKADWSIQDTQLQLVPQDSYIPGEAIVLTSQTGMIGLPQQDQNGITIKCLLNPNARISGLVQIDNKSVQLGEFSLTNSDSATKSNAFLREFGHLNNDGIYKILVAEHDGDTRGESWHTTLRCIDVDMSVSAGLLASRSVAPAGAVKPWG